MNIIDIILLVVSLIFIAGVSALMPLMAWKEYKYEKKRNEDLRKTSTEAKFLNDVG